MSVPGRQHLAELVSRATDHTVGVDELLASTEPLTALGVSSLSLLRLADALEAEFGIVIDLADRTLYTAGLDGLVTLVRDLGASV
ncbi:hypothetical protein SRB5_56100 [Streptomyces sp. RB5]|uniref:Carrier domain-containing protein n=1 Tax=Streptomyces smaragdinus TaxID=2585196 RepID=A0A7K0CPM2_9ACTN|nr:acyl carrier protein [Streptomyces smaragdinus]MQY15428.1 hypothetical protein [Streptomyces smaragdinus]